MQNKTLTLIFALIAFASSAYALYAWNRLHTLQRESENWKEKYEEAIIDAEEAVERIKKMEKELEAALRQADAQCKEALEFMEQSKKKKASR